MASPNPEGNENNKLAYENHRSANNAQHARPTAGLYNNPRQPEYVPADSDEHRSAEQSYWKRQVCWQAVGALATIFAFGAAAVYAHYAQQQVTVMQRAAEDNEALQRAVLTIDNFIVSGYPPSRPNEGYRISFTLKNEGNSTAEEIRVFTGGSWSGNPPNKINRGQEFNGNASIAEPTKREQQVGFNLGAGKDRLIDDGVQFIEGDVFVKKVIAGTATETFYVSVGYFDIFDHPHFVSECRIYNSRTRGFDMCAYDRHHD